MPFAKQNKGKLWLRAACFTGLVVNFLAFYPGFLSPDSLDQFRQSVTGHYYDWHPPIMAFFWHFLDFVYKGPQLMLLFQLGCLWLSAYVLATTFRGAVWKLLLALAVLAPFVINFSGYIIKDSQMGLSWLLAFSIIFRAHLGGRRLSGREALWSLLLLAYGTWMRPNAFPGFLPLAYYWASNYLENKTSWHKVKYAAGLLIVVLGCQWLVTTVFIRPEKAHPENKLFLHDLTGIYVFTGDSRFPADLMDVPKFDTAAFKAMYHPATFDLAWWDNHGNETYPRLDDRQSRELKRAWVKAILRHPVSYLAHRTLGFLYYLRIRERSREFHSYFMWVAQNEFGFHIVRNFLYEFLLLQIMDQSSMFFMTPWFWLLVNLALVPLLLLIRNGKIRLPARVLVFSSLLYQAPSFFIFQVDTDFRYFYWNCIACTIALCLIIISWLPAGKPATPAGPQMPVLALRRFGREYWPGLLMLAAAVAICVATYQNRGVGWDETTQRADIGYVSYNYAVHNDPALFTNLANDHGPAFELVLIFIEKIFDLTDTRDIFLSRHLSTHLFFLLGVFAGYVLIQRLWRNQLISCAGFFMLAFMPRIYAHSFVNTKDLPFLTMYLFIFLNAYQAFSSKRWVWFLLLGALCGFATGIRIMGIMLPVGFAALLLAEMPGTDRATWRRQLYFTLVLIAGFFGALYTWWPYLWPSPVGHFRAAFGTLAHYSPGQTLFNGRMVSTAALPRYYIPEWMVLTIPLAWLATGLCGLVLIAWQAVRRPMAYLRHNEERSYLLYLYCFGAPLLMVIVLHSSVYDDWRHLYFIYPAMVLAACYLLHRLRPTKFFRPVAALILLQCAVTGVAMVRMQPMQAIYFNRLMPRSREFVRNHFDFEYWGVSYKQGLEWLLATDTSKVIRVTGGNELNILVTNNLQLLTPKQRSRIVVGTDTTADYFITNFRWHPGDYSYPVVYHEFSAYNSTYLRIYRLRQPAIPPAGGYKP